MKERAGSMPRARREGLVLGNLPGEVLVYDCERDKAHCLNQTAALVWNYCDGKTTVSTMARRLERDLDTDEVDEKIVWYALDQLSKDHLLEEQFVSPAMLSGITRRQVVRALGVAIAIPLVTSIVAPTAMAGGSCVSPGQPCQASAQCCTQLCNQGVCEPGPPV
jgi:hypothetical protein